MASIELLARLHALTADPDAAQRRHRAIRAAHTTGVTLAMESSAAWLAQRISAFVTTRPGVADVSAPVRVLDIGCGDGRVGLGVARGIGQHPTLLRTKFAVWLNGLDSDLQQVAQTQALYATATDVAGLGADVGDALALPFEADSFEAVLLLRMLNQTGDIDRALREAARVLWPGGLLFVATTDIARTAAERTALDSPIRAIHEAAQAALGFPPRLYSHTTPPDQRLGLANAQKWLRPHFADIEEDVYQRSLAFRNLPELMEFYATGYMFHKADGIENTPGVSPDMWADLYTLVETALADALHKQGKLAWRDGMALIVAAEKR